MDMRTESETLLGKSVARRLAIFALFPVALDALAYVACLRLFNGDQLTAAIVAMVVPLFLGIAVHVAGLLTLPLWSRKNPVTANFGTAETEAAYPRGAKSIARWGLAMRLLFAAAFIGMLGYVFGAGYALIAIVAAMGGRSWLAAVLAAAFTVALLAIIRFYARFAFSLRGRLALPVAAVQACVVAGLGYMVHPFLVTLGIVAVAFVGLVALIAFPENAAISSEKT